MTIFIESRICQELGINYNNPGEESTIDKNDFIEKWGDIHFITTGDPPDTPYSRSKFSQFIVKQTGNKMNLINKGSGYFELK